MNLLSKLFITDWKDRQSQKNKAQILMNIHKVMFVNLTQILMIRKDLRQSRDLAQKRSDKKCCPTFIPVNPSIPGEKVESGRN